MDGEREETIREFYRIYRRLQKECNLRMHSRFSLSGDGLIEIWEYSGETRGRCICRVTEETDTDCYRRAISDLEYHENSRRDRAAERAG